MRVVSVLVVVVLAVGVVSLVVLSLLDVLLLVVDASLGEVIALSLRGVMVHSLPFVAFVLLQRDESGFPVVFPVLVVVVGWIQGLMLVIGWFPIFVGMVGWIVLTPLWSRWLSTSFTLLVLT
jgi:hypothetical protein